MKENRKSTRVYDYFSVIYLGCHKPDMFSVEGQSFICPKLNTFILQRTLGKNTLRFGAPNYGVNLYAHDLPRD